MRKTIFAKKIFIFLILVFLSTPMLLLFGINDFGKLYAPEANQKKPEALFKGYEYGGFQESFEDWFSRYFIGRDFLIEFRNTAYFLGNFKYFTFMKSYRQIILKNNIQISEHTLEVETPDQGLFEKILFIQKETEKRGKKILFIMAPNNVHLSFYQHLQYPYQKYFGLFSYLNETDTYKESKIYLDKFGINYFDAQEYFESLIEKGDLNAVSPYDNHWTRYGAGLTVVKSLNILKNKYKTNWNIPKVISVSFSTEAAQYDRNKLDSMNIFETFEPEHNKFPIPVYEKLLKNNTNQLKVVILGDSFGGEYSNQLLESGIIVKENMVYYGGIIDDEKVYSADILVLIVTEFNIMRRLKQIVDHLYNYYTYD
jgi:hypothetical protein